MTCTVIGMSGGRECAVTGRNSIAQKEISTGYQQARNPWQTHKKPLYQPEIGNFGANEANV
jgi:hypothetical protein